jgi:hypothetical protein
MDANCLVKPRRSIAKTQSADPINMNGRRRPKRDLELSARTPTYIPIISKIIDEIKKRISAPMRGWTISPESGPAMKTSAMCDFDTPSESRYGDAAYQNH